MRTSIQQAFLNVNNPPPVIGAACKRFLKREGVQKLRGWNAHLSFRTYHDLKSQGVMPEGV